MSWVELDRIVSEEIVRDDDIRRRVAASGRPLRSHAKGMSDDDLLAKLRGIGVDADREKLAGLCDRALSAEEVVSERLRLHDWDADWAWICLTELWQRWWPEKACLELLDDKIQEATLPASATTSSPATGFGSVPGRTCCGCAMPSAPGRSGSSTTVSR